MRGLSSVADERLARRLRLAGLAFLLAGLLATTLAPAPAWPAGAAASGPAAAEPVAARSGAVRAVDAVGLTVSSLERSVEFFSKVLKFEMISEKELAGDDYERLQGVFGLRVRVARLRLGDESIELYEYLAPRGRPMPVDSRSNDRWFQHIAIIVSDMDQAYRLLRENRVEHASPGPQRLPEWNRAAGGIQAFYFKDPDGHPLEILSFPEGKGDAKWHRRSDRLFLGIDHTAIVVSDTEASLRLYRDALGLRVAGESENFGIEQERLNNVFGARLRITALRAAQGPGIELLEYLAPRDGRPRPADIRANDLLHWQTRLVASSVEAAAATLRAAHTPFVSPGVIGTPGRELGFRQGASVQDPDGHVLQLADTGGTDGGPETWPPSGAPKLRIHSGGKPANESDRGASRQAEQRSPCPGARSEPGGDPGRLGRQGAGAAGGCGRHRQGDQRR
jgi:catechol 2,3-dioxygenase-like lactoylglutathione lyase family enzyme